MSALTFTLKAEPPASEAAGRLDLAPLTPTRLIGMSALDIAALALGPAADAPTVGDIFAISGDDAADIRFAAGSPLFDRLGAGMAGGRISVDGSVGDYAGAGMRGGRIEIGGDAGDFAGGSPDGTMAGMRGGVLLVEGAVGERAGDRMKRGLLVALGGTGDAAGSRMLGGTILALRLGRHAGWQMARGTLIAMGMEPPLPTFTPAGTYCETFLSVFQRYISDEVPEAEDLLFGRARRLYGDLAVKGKGEIMVPA